MNLISLPETKNYLRVDHCEDDKLILTLIDTAQRLVMNVGRMNEKQLAENEETSRQAMLYTVSCNAFIYSIYEQFNILYVLKFLEASSIKMQFST